MLFQIFFTIIFAGALALTWRRVRQGALRFMEGIIWTVIWGAGLVIFWRPEATNFLADIVGIGRGADLVMYVAVIFLLCFAFLLALSIDRLERQMTKLVQHQALEEFRRARAQKQI